MTTRREDIITFVQELLDIGFTKKDALVEANLKFETSYFEESMPKPCFFKKEGTLKEQEAQG